MSLECDFSFMSTLKHLDAWVNDANPSTLSIAHNNISEISGLAIFLIWLLARIVIIVSMFATQYFYLFTLVHSLFLDGIMAIASITLAIAAMFSGGEHLCFLVATT